MFPETEFHCTFTTPSIHPLSATNSNETGDASPHGTTNKCLWQICLLHSPCNKLAEASGEIRKFLLMRLRWRVLTKKAFHFFTRIVKSSSWSFMVLPTDRPTDLPETRGLMWMPSGDCRQFHLARVGNSSDAGHAVFEGSFSCIST